MRFTRFACGPLDEEPCPGHDEGTTRWERAVENMSVHNVLGEHWHVEMGSGARSAADQMRLYADRMKEAAAKMRSEPPPQLVSQDRYNALVREYYEKFGGSAPEPPPPNRATRRGTKSDTSGDRAAPSGFRSSRGAWSLRDRELRRGHTRR